MLKTFLRREGNLQQADLRDYLQEIRSRFIEVKDRLILSRTGLLDSLGLHVKLMSNNATVFFDHLARENNIPLLD